MMQADGKEEITEKKAKKAKKDPKDAEGEEKEKGFFKADPTKNPNVYVQGLPTDVRQLKPRTSRFSSSFLPLVCEYSTARHSK